MARWFFGMIRTVLADFSYLYAVPVSTPPYGRCSFGGVQSGVSQ